MVFLKHRDSLEGAMFTILCEDCYAAWDPVVDRVHAAVDWNKRIRDTPGGLTPIDITQWYDVPLDWYAECNHCWTEQTGEDYPEDDYAEDDYADDPPPPMPDMARVQEWIANLQEHIRVDEA